MGSEPHSTVSLAGYHRRVVSSDARIRGLGSVQRALLDWHDAHRMHAPWRDSGDPYQCLVAAVMAQQTQMSRVMSLYARFTQAFPTVEALAAASPGEVIRAWQGMGYNQRAVRLHRAAREIVAGGWPRDAAALAKISGIGPFTAAIIASFAFGEPAACVDTNVQRVLGRLAGEPSIGGARLQRLADASMAAEHPARWNQALMDYGAAICGVRPKCGECVVRRWCASRSMFEAPAGVVAEERPLYRRAKATKTERFEASRRYLRGRIVDALRASPPGAWVTAGSIARAIRNEHVAPTAEDVRAMLSELERQGLAETSGGRARLPA